MRMSSNQKAADLAQYLEPVLSKVAVEKSAAPSNGTPGEHEPDIGRALQIELSQLLGGHEKLRKAVESHVALGKSSRVTEQLADALARDDENAEHSRDLLWALLGGDVPAAPPRDRGVLRRTWHRMRTGGYGAWMARKAAAIWLNLLIAMAVLLTGLAGWHLEGRLTMPTADELGGTVLKIFALWSLAFLPGWLYVRFIGQRAGALWNEYVLHLHRLGWDCPEFLPRPPRSSSFFAEWHRRGGPLLPPTNNIYRQKFNAYYGKFVADNAQQKDFQVRTEAMFPIFLTTAVLAAGWATILWEPTIVTGTVSDWEILKFAFLGAYAFIVLSLVRRFFQSDLRPSAYTSALVRIAVVLITVTVLHQVVTDTQPPQVGVALAFVVGFFPLIGLEIINRVVARAFGVLVPQLVSDYPLNQLDGMNIWYEARFVEEGIEDMENLVTANFVDVILHTRVPVGRLVDWLDQALLCLHLDPVATEAERRKKEKREARKRRKAARSAPDQTVPAEPPASPPDHDDAVTRPALRRLGIRTATDLLNAFPPDQIDPVRVAGAAGTDKAFRKLEPGSHLDIDQLRTLVRTLSEDTRLAAVWNWHARGVEARDRRRQPRTRHAPETEAHTNGATVTSSAGDPLPAPADEN